MANKKITPTDLRQRAQQLIDSGRMPPLEDLLAAIAETTTKFLPLIAAARAERRQ
jgi:hypothetical protein